MALRPGKNLVEANVLEAAIVFMSVPESDGRTNSMGRQINVPI